MAGDRDNASIRKLASTIAQTRPDRIIVKELEDYLRGREQGEVPALIIEELLASGVPPEAIGQATSEMDAIRQALAWAQKGDLLLLITHSSRSGVVSYLENLQAKGWSPGDPVSGLAT